jgi:Bacterial mobilisation protein (MobC)
MADPLRWFGRRPAPEPEPGPPAAVPEPPAGPAASPVPPGPRGERTKTVAVRLTPEEHAVWTAAAEAQGRAQMGRWVRETVTARLQDRPAPVPAESVEQVRLMRAELARVGSNLNQIAKALNIAALGGGQATGTGQIAASLAEVRELLGSVRDELRER